MKTCIPAASHAEVFWFYDHLLCGYWIHTPEAAFWGYASCRDPRLCLLCALMHIIRPLDVTRRRWVTGNRIVCIHVFESRAHSRRWAPIALGALLTLRMRPKPTSLNAHLHIYKRQQNTHTQPEQTFPSRGRDTNIYWMFIGIPSMDAGRRVYVLLRWTMRSTGGVLSTCANRALCLIFDARGRLWNTPRRTPLQVSAYS